MKNLENYFFEDAFCLKGLESIDLNKLLSIRKFQKNWDKETGIILVRRFIKALCAGIVDFRSIEIFEKSSPLVFFSSSGGRYGQNIIIEKVSSLQKGMDLVLWQKGRIKIKFDLFYYYCFTHWIKYLWGLPFSKRQFLTILFDISEAYKLKKSFSKNVDLSRYQVLTVLFDASLQDNLIVQLAKQKGIKTVTLQHGHFNFPEDANKRTPNSSFGGFISDYMLVWGPYTKEEAIRAGIDENRIQIMGIPYYISAKKTAEKQGYFSVFLDADIFYKDNLAMIDVATAISQHFDLDVRIKLHPSSKVKNYETPLSTFSDSVVQGIPNEVLLSKSFFVIASSSSLIIEAAFWGVPVFRFQAQEAKDVYKGVDFLKFANVEQGIELVKKYFEEPGIIKQNLENLKKELVAEGSPEENYERFYASLLINQSRIRTHK